MQELSMNLLDIAQNSVAAGSTLTQITIAIDTAAKRLTLTIADNGKGMDEETVRRVTDPFYTTRTTRKVGLGLPLFQEAARATGGDVTIRSAVGTGTTVEAFCMDTRQLRQMLDGVSLATPQVAIFLREYLEEHTENLLKRSTQI